MRGKFLISDFELGKGLLTSPHSRDALTRAKAAKGARNGRVEDCGGPEGELNLEYEMGSFRAAFLVAGG